MNRIQYRFAFDGDGRLIDVSELTRGGVSTAFACVGCGARLVAHLKDDLRARHFAHFRAGNCVAYETYLHRAAKHAFLQTYRDCVKSGWPFMLRLPVTDQCIALKTALGIVCDMPRYREIDLTKWFDSADTEKGHEGFVADILLSGAKMKEPMFVEVAVTHPCDQEKIASGTRILELAVKSDADIAAVNGAAVTVTLDGGHRAHNFRTKQLREPICGGNCEKPVGVFVIHRTGSPKLFQTTAGRALTFKPTSAVWQKVLVGFGDAPPHISIEQLDYVGMDLPPGDSLYQRGCIAAVGDGVPVKSCEVCRRQGSPSGLGQVWCFVHRENVHPSRASECESFQSVCSVGELTRLRQRNALAQKRRRLRSGW